MVCFFCLVFFSFFSFPLALSLPSNHLSSLASTRFDSIPAHLGDYLLNHSPHPTILPSITMPEFKNLNQDSGLTELNKYLETRSYIDGSD